MSARNRGRVGNSAVPAMITPITAVPTWSFQLNWMPAFAFGMTIAVTTKTVRMMADATIEIRAVRMGRAVTTRSRGAGLITAGTRGCS
jgi:hypothetical protein